MPRSAPHRGTEPPLPLEQSGPSEAHLNLTEHRAARMEFDAKFIAASLMNHNMPLRVAANKFVCLHWMHR